MKATLLAKNEIEKNDSLKQLIKTDFKNNCVFRPLASIEASSIPLRDFNVNSSLAESYYVIPNGSLVSMNISEPLAIAPIISYNSVRNDCKLIEETEDKIIVEYGSYPLETISSDQTLLELKRQYAIGNLLETDELVTIIVHTDGTKDKARKYKDKNTGAEYVFICKRNEHYIFSIDDISIDDIISETGRVGIVKPIRWVVDKKSGIMFSKNPLFISEPYGYYEKSELKKYLASDEFFKDIGVIQRIIEKDKKSNMPWSPKRKEQNISLKEQINIILMGKHRIPYLVGHPGVGKTAIAKSINSNYLAYNISTFTPDMFSGKTVLIPGKTKVITDETGITYSEGMEAGTTSIAKPDWYKKLIEMSENCAKKGERCLLFFDEFDKLTPNMQVFINGVVDTPRTIANLEIPDNVDIIFAGNTEEYSDAAFSISGEVESRLTRLNVTPNYINWLTWASENDIDPLVKAYLFMSSSDIIKDVKTSDGRYDYCKSLTPRSWDQKISEEIKVSRKLGSYPMLENYMDESSRKKFEDFMDNYFYLNIEQIAEGEYGEVDVLTYDQVEIQTIVNCLVAIVTTDEQLENTMEFLKKIGNQEYKDLFTTMWLKIHSSEKDILKLRTAENVVFSESEAINYGK